MSSSSHTPLTLPYFAASSDLPAPLPSFEAIVSASFSFPHRRGRRVVRLPGGGDGDGRCHFVAKWGAGVRVLEAENMLFVQRHCPRMRVPRLYAAYQRRWWCNNDHNDDDENITTTSSSSSGGNGSTRSAEQQQLVTVLVMQYIDGEPLGRLFRRPELGFHHRHRRAVAADLAAQFDALRRVPQPPSSSGQAATYFGALGRRPFQNGYWRGDAGPFGCVEAYTDAVFRIEGSSSAGGGGGGRGEQTERDAIRARFEHVVRGRGIARGEEEAEEYARPVFTHADLHAGNVVVRWKGDGQTRKGDDDDEEEGEFEAWVIDWESSGWHAPYWEFVCVCSAGGFSGERDPWYRMLGRVLKPYYEEDEMLMRVRRIGGGEVR